MTLSKEITYVVNLLVTGVALEAQFTSEDAKKKIEKDLIALWNDFFQLMRQVEELESAYNYEEDTELEKE